MWPILKNKQVGIHCKVQKCLYVNIFANVSNVDNIRSIVYLRKHEIDFFLFLFLHFYLEIHFMLYKIFGIVNVT